MKDPKSSTIDKYGRIHLPATALRALGVKRGDRLELTIEEHRVTLSTPRSSSVAALVGAAGRLDQRPTLKEMREIANEDRPKMQKLAPLTTPTYTLEEVFGSVPPLPDDDEIDLDERIRLTQDEHMAEEARKFRET